MGLVLANQLEGRVVGISAENGLEFGAVCVCKLFYCGRYGEMCVVGGAKKADRRVRVVSRPFVFGLHQTYRRACLHAAFLRLQVFPLAHTAMISLWVLTAAIAALLCLRSAAYVAPSTTNLLHLRREPGG